MDIIKHLEDLPNYQAQADEPYMNCRQIEHFKNKLIAWKKLIHSEIEETIQTLKEEEKQTTDILDRASQEHNLSVELRTRDREHKLLKKIDDALMRIEFGNYGYCKETGDEIGVERLDARPISDLCIQAKKIMEKQENRY
jgi:DnaK suppressor protein